MKEFICIICPNGCHITIDDDGKISGNKCPRGINYVKQESTHPLRTVTSTCKVIDSDTYRVVSCKTSTALPKEKIFDVMKEINKVRVKLPISMHQVLIKNVLNTGADIIATQEIK